VVRLFDDDFVAWDGGGVDLVDFSVCAFDDVDVAEVT